MLSRPLARALISSRLGCCRLAPSARALAQSRFATGTRLQSSTSEDTSAKKKVLDQYNDEAAIFYRKVMGGGDNNIHYGIFIGDAARDNSRILDASHNTIDFVAELMEVAARGDTTFTSKVLELGSATGGTAHRLIQRYGFHVTGLNICPDQNAAAEAAARERGLAEKFTTVTGSFDEPWPEEWSESFDVVLSVDSLVHSNQKAKVLCQIARVLKPGGVLAFADVLSTEAATKEQHEEMSKAVTGLSFTRPSEYMQHIVDAGLSLGAYVDFTDHLALNYASMVHQIDAHRQELKLAGVSDEYMDNYRASFVKRIDQISAGTYGVGWGAFSAVKRPIVSKVGCGLAASLRA